MTACNSKKPENLSCRDFSALEGTGDGKKPLSKLDKIKSEKGKELKGVNRKTAERPSPVPFSDFSTAAHPNDLADFEAHIAPLIQARWPEEREGFERFLRANPGMTVRDWKGKGPSIPIDEQPWEKPWHKLKPDEVAAEAVRWFARQLSRNLRQAAARHPDLVWNDYARKYRRRLPSDQPDGRGP